jgi:hypothetical protein
MTIDQVSSAIGALQADAASAQRQRTELFDQQGEIKDHLTDIKVLLGEHVSEVKGKLGEHEEDITKLQGNVGTLNKFKNRVYIGLAGVGGTGGVGGWIAAKLGLGA